MLQICRRLIRQSNQRQQHWTTYWTNISLAKQSLWWALGMQFPETQEYYSEDVRKSVLEATHWLELNYVRLSNWVEYGRFDTKVLEHRQLRHDISHLLNITKNAPDMEWRRK